MRYLVLIPLLPALGAVLNGLVGIRYFSKRASAWLACGTMAGSLALSVAAFIELVRLPVEARDVVVRIATWIPPIPLATEAGIGAFTVDWALRLDPLSSMMILVVTGVGFLIHVYSTAYMHGESRGSYARFFAYLNLFCFFMLTLVLASNFLVMFVGWEGVGLCSYLLIGYWYEKKSASDAGKKAFIVNRIGDFGFMLGMFLIFFTFGSLDFAAVAEGVAARPIEAGTFGVLSLASLLLFVGATGKSAQIPLYVWLPDAMEGPTPVSALIHAATMVTAGVYMVCRNAVLFTHAPEVMTIVAVVGLLTALMAATIGLVQNDIKRVLAYSTVSQLGYMFLATGVGAFAAGAFHLMTHAFFKALLFLGSGSVIHAMNGEQDMRRMGDLRRFLPVTFATMMVGTLAIAGVPPLSGFFSKDEILYRTFLENRLLWGLAVVTAGMTAFYMLRLMSLTFFGLYRGPAYGGGHGASAPAGGHGIHMQAADVTGRARPADAGHGGHDAGHGHGNGGWHGPHESPRAMTWPLVALAVGASVAGFVGVPAALMGNNAIEHFLEPSFTVRTAEGTDMRPAGTGPRHDVSPALEADEHVLHAEPPPPSHGEEEPHSLALELGLMALSVLVGLAGIFLAWRFYVLRPEISERLATRWAGPHRVLTNKYYVDEAYDATAVRGTMGAARGSWWVDTWIVDGIVNGSGWSTRAMAWVSGMFDRHVVDGLVNGTGISFREASHGFRRFQTGLIQNYALVMLIGVFMFVSVYLLVR
jgi:NADH-quinone oxidoreductase subunit L